MLYVVPFTGLGWLLISLVDRRGRRLQGFFRRRDRL